MTKVKMTKKEKQIFLITIMHDMRCIFPWTKGDVRLTHFFEMCTLLKENSLIEETNKTLEQDDYLDGRFFRDCKNNYSVLQKKYKLEDSDFLLKDKSREFKDKVFHCLQGPEYIFDDYDETARKEFGFE